MSVDPGFTGQQFIPHSVTRSPTRALLTGDAGAHAEIEVDGGVDPANARSLVQAGASFWSPAPRSSTPPTHPAVRALRRAADGR